MIFYVLLGINIGLSIAAYMSPEFRNKLADVLDIPAEQRW